MQALEQQFHCAEPKLEIHVGPAGITATSDDEEKQTIAWDDMAEVRYAPPAESVELVSEDGETTISVPFDAASEDGTFDDLLHTVLYHAQCVGQLPDALQDEAGDEAGDEGRIVFGVWRRRRILTWLALTLAGGAAALHYLPQHGHWIFGLIVAGLWLMLAYYAGFKQECRVHVKRDGCALHKLFSSRRYRFAELSNLGVKLENPDAKSGKRLCLVVTPRAGWPEQITTLGAETFEAFFTLRQGIRTAPDE